MVQTTKILQRIFLQRQKTCGSVFTWSWTCTGKRWRGTSFKIIVVACVTASKASKCCHWVPSESIIWSSGKRRNPVVSHRRYNAGVRVLYTPASPVPKQVRMSKYRVKVMLIIFSTNEAVCATRTKIKQSFYLEVLKRLQNWVKRIRKEINYT